MKLTLTLLRLLFMLATFGCKDRCIDDLERPNYHKNYIRILIENADTTIRFDKVNVVDPKLLSATLWYVPISLTQNKIVITLQNYTPRIDTLEISYTISEQYNYSCEKPSVSTYNHRISYTTLDPNYRIKIAPAQ